MRAMHRERAIELGVGDVVDLDAPGRRPSAGSSAGGRRRASCRSQRRLDGSGVEGATHREAEAGEQGVDALARAPRRPRAAAMRGHGAQAEHDRLAVRQAVARLDLQRVADRVAQVELPPLAVLVGIALDDAELQAHRALGDRVARGLVRMPRVERGFAALPRCSDHSRGSPMSPALSDSAMPSSRRARRSVPTARRVGDDGDRRPEGARGVLGRDEVDRGLAADRRVGLRQPRGRAPG